MNKVEEKAIELKEAIREALLNDDVDFKVMPSVNINYAYDVEVKLSDSIKCFFSLHKQDFICLHKPEFIGRDDFLSKEEVRKLRVKCDASYEISKSVSQEIAELLNKVRELQEANAD